MLIETNVKTSDIISIKLSNGDEIIGRVSSIESDTVTITKPLAMMLAQDPRTGQAGVQMIPFWMLGADKDAKFPIQRSHIVCMVKSNPDAVKGYTANTSGLTIPSSGAASSLIS